MFLQGSMTALTTSFTCDGLDQESDEFFIEWQISEGINGLGPAARRARYRR